MGPSCQMVLVGARKYATSWATSPTIGFSQSIMKPGSPSSTRNWSAVASVFWICAQSRGSTGSASARPGAPSARIRIPRIKDARVFKDECIAAWRRALAELPVG